MAEIIPIRPGRGVSPWCLVTIEHDFTMPGFSVCAWTGAPGALGVDRMYCGHRPTLAEAATFAQAKAAQLGAREIVDFTDIVPGPGEAA